MPSRYLSSPPSAVASWNVRCASAAVASRIAAKPAATTAIASTLRTCHMKDSPPTIPLYPSRGRVDSPSLDRPMCEPLADNAGAA